MSLSKATIENAIRPVMTANLENNDPEQSRENFIKAMAEAIANAIKDGVEGAEIAPALTSPSGAVTGDIVITVNVVP
jgi:hypothetical protein